MAWGLMGDTPRDAELSKLGTSILRIIVRAKDFWDSVLWEHFLEQWDNFGGVALARWETSDEDHLWVEVTTYEVVSSFQGKDVWGTHLPWVGQSWHRSEGCCSILSLELGASFTLVNNFFNGFVYTRPEHTSMHEQLGFGWFLDGTGVVGVLFSSFLKEEKWGLLNRGQDHLQQGGSHDVASRGVRCEEPPWYHLMNWWWWCQQGHTSLDHSWRLVEMLPSSLGTGEHDEWQYPVECQGQEVDWSERGHLAGPFPYWCSNGECSHSPGGTVACAAAGLVCLPGSSGRCIPGLWSEDDSEHLSFYVGVTVFGIGEGFAAKGHRFVVLKECCTKVYL